MEQLDALIVFAMSYNDDPNPDWWSNEWDLAHTDDNTLDWGSCWIPGGQSGALSPNTWYTIDAYLWQGCTADSFLEIDIDGIPAIYQCGGGWSCPYGGYFDSLMIGVPWNNNPNADTITHWTDNVRWWYDTEMLVLPTAAAACCD